MKQAGRGQQGWDRLWTKLYPYTPVPDDPNRHRRSPVVYLGPTHPLLTRPSVFNAETPKQLLGEVRSYRAEHPGPYSEYARLRDENLQLRNQIEALTQTAGAVEPTFQGPQLYQTPNNNGIASDHTTATTSHTHGTGQLPYYDLVSTPAGAQYDNAAAAMTSQLEHNGQPAMQQWQQRSDPSSSFSQMGNGAKNPWLAQVHGGMNDQAGNGNENDNFPAHLSVRADDSGRFPNPLLRDTFMGFQSTSDTGQDLSEQPPTQSHPTQSDVGMVPSVLNPAIGGAEDFMNPSAWLPPPTVQMQDQQRADGIPDQSSGQWVTYATTTDTDYSMFDGVFSSPSFPDNSHPFGAHENNGIPAPPHPEENIHDLVRENDQAAGTTPWRNGQGGAYRGRNDSMGQ